MRNEHMLQKTIDIFKRTMFLFIDVTTMQKENTHDIHATNFNPIFRSSVPKLFVLHMHLEHVCVCDFLHRIEKS